MPPRCCNIVETQAHSSPKNPNISVEAFNNSCLKKERNEKCTSNNQRIFANYSNGSPINSCPRNPDISIETHTKSCLRKSNNSSIKSQSRNEVCTSNIQRMFAHDSIESPINSCPRNPDVSEASHVSSCHCNENLDPTDDVGHISHIPRTPPTPATYTIPSIGPTMSSTCGTCGTVHTDPNMSKCYEKIPNADPSTPNAAVPTFYEDESLFGMIALKENDVCYTSGTIEWVGRKRSYPLNTGFKVMKDTYKNKATICNESKKKRKLDHIFTVGMDSTRECECADMLPTVNAIVDHLNAIHEAVDLVDLRLSNLEETL